MAVPVRATVAVGVFGSSLETDTAPEKFPAVLGEKVRFRVMLPPAGTVAGVLIALPSKPFPETAI